MIGYDYEIIYKKGKLDVVVDALYRNYENEGSLFFLIPCTKLTPSYSLGMDARPKNFSPDPKITTPSSRFSRVLLKQ